MSKENNIFSDETIKSIAELGDVLKRIRTRLLAEGIITIGPDNKVIFPKYEETKRSAKNDSRRA